MRTLSFMQHALAKWLLLLLFVSGLTWPAWASDGPGPKRGPDLSLAQALNPDGTLRPGTTGSFDALGYQLSTTEDGRPAFRPLNTTGAGDNRWQDGFGTPGTNGQVNVAVVAPNGDLYIGGQFSIAGKVIALNVARWNGTTWSALGSGVNNSVNALAISGTDVYVGGNFTQAGGQTANYIAKWNGSTWSGLGTGLNSSVSALAVAGNNLYVGGSFTTASGTTASRVAKWDGTNWSTLGTGTAEGVNGSVRALAATSTGRVYVGGDYTQAGGQAISYLAQWDGSTWSNVGTGVGGTGYRNVQALGLSSTNELYASGYFTQIGGVAANNIAKWNGTTWSALGTGLSSPAVRLALSATDELYLVGPAQAGGQNINGIARWNGTWAELPGAGLGNSNLQGIAVAGQRVYIAGDFIAAGGRPANRVTVWDGSTWAALGEGLNLPVRAVAVSGNTIYASYLFNSPAPAYYIVQWNGTSWVPVGEAFNSFVNVMAVDGNGQLYVGGEFTQIGSTAIKYLARWNGTTWNSLGDGVNNTVQALATSGSTLYAGGAFTTAGAVTASGVAKWDATTATWSRLGGGVRGQVRALAVAGSTLYVGGGLTGANGSGIPVNRVAKWDGAAWSALGTGVTTTGGGYSIVHTLATDSNGDLYVGGEFTTAGSLAANNIAKWSNSSWSTLGSGVNGPVIRLATNGTDLYVGGEFGTAGGQSAFYIAKWASSNWSPLGTGLNGSVLALTVGAGSKVYVGGSFTNVGDGSKVFPYLGIYSDAPAPTLTNFTPPNGPVGTNVTLTGTNFTSTTAVAFNGTLAPGFIVVSDTRITVNVPAGATTGPISVTTPSGTATSATSFTVTAPLPVVSGLSTAAELVGMPVTITGSNFTPGSTVSFGGVLAANVTYNSASSLTALIPAAAPAGASSVVVTTANGSSVGSPAFEVLHVYEGPVSTCPSTTAYVATGDGLWHYLRTANGRVVAALQDTRAALGTVTVSLQVSSPTAAVRQDGSGRKYLDRNFKITTSGGDFTGQLVNVRFYALLSELSHLQEADPTVTMTSLNTTQYRGANEDCDFNNNDFSTGEFRSLAAPASSPGANYPWFVAQVAVFNHFSEFYLTGSGSPLPVTLTSFTAKRQGAAVVLRWSTAQEKDNAYFIVETSSDGHNFRSLGRIAGHGTSSTPRHYEFTDAAVRATAPTLYYRLRQLDADGSVHLSPVRTIGMSEATQPLLLWPNPAREEVQVSGVAPKQLVQLLDGVGRVVASGISPEQGPLVLKIPAQLPAGIYTVRSSGGTSKLVVR
ncbi:beta strand repeat-containing protein [Hymenobacter cellulosivorans]|uniref:IPT/TIG domain-containing protein n=1 Tax=Hymenobacter cellulosivorans TaxID=2932249 RepID=A0ABY4F5M8_9BACT|nr:IPT/TIG domain-containing protein [Hymenobacter cellulosivorans]UOQ51951.1 IPT/TIG domain-containing protein [Hymenobacter cellulosivorans]